MKPIDIINRSARRINLVASGTVLPNDEAIDALLELNSIISQMSLSELLAKNGLNHPLTLTSEHTGMDDQVEYALIDMLSVRLADLYRIEIPQSLVQASMSAKKRLKRRTAKTIKQPPNLALLNRDC